MSRAHGGFSRRSLLKASALTAGAISLGGLTSACGGPGSGSGGARTATYQLSWTHSVQFGGTYLAQKRGYFSDAGLDVTLAAGGPNVAGDANTVSGTSLVNISGGDGVARSNAEGAGLVIVGAQYQKAANTILSLGDNPLQTPEDLIGARIGVADVNTPALEAFAEINGLDNSRIEYVPTQYDPAPLVAGQVDGLFCFAIDLPVALATQGIEGHSMLLSEFGYNPMSQVYTVLRSNLEGDRRQDILDLFRADARGWQDFQTEYEEAAELTVEDYPDAGLDLETQKVQAEVQLGLMYDDQTAANGFGWFSEEDVDANLELFGLLGIDGAERSLWDHSILDELYADGPTL